MSDDTWAELLRSPLDPESKPGPRSGPELSWKLGLIVLVAGVVTGGALAAWRGGEASAAGETTPSSTTATTSTATVPASSEPSYPDGYVEVVDGVGIRPLGWYRNQGSLFVVVSTSVRSDLDPLETEAMRAGSWALVEGGRVVEYASQVWDQPALGVTAIEFADVSQLPETLRFASVVDQHVDTLTLTPLAGYPIEAAGPFSFTLEHDLDFIVDSVTAAAGWGSLEWHVAGGSDESARASVGTVAVLAGTDDPGTPDEVDPTLLVSPHLAPPYPFQLHVAPPPGFTYAGSEQLVRVREPLGQDNWPTSVEIELTVDMIFPGEGDSAIVEISLTGLPELS